MAESLLAGRDTTAATLTFVVYFLSQYPHVMERLRQEVLDKVGPTRRPTFDDVREMKYLRAVLNGKLSSLFLFRIIQHTRRDPSRIPNRSFQRSVNLPLSYP